MNEEERLAKMGKEFKEAMGRPHKNREELRIFILGRGVGMESGIDMMITSLEQARVLYKKE